MSTTEAPALTAITKDDVRAIKEANTVVLFWRPNGEEGPASGIRLHREIRFDGFNATLVIRRTEQSGLWERRWTGEDYVEYSRTIAASVPPRIETYGGAGEPRFASWVGLYLRSYDEVRSMLSLIKAGDKIGVLFKASNNTESQRMAGFVSDEVLLVIERGGKRLTFLLDTYCGPDNTARLVAF